MGNNRIFKNRSAFKKGWKMNYGTTELTNKQIKYLEENGWKISE